jgi:hypothetical protein
MSSLTLLPIYSDHGGSIVAFHVELLTKAFWFTSMSDPVDPDSGQKDDTRVVFYYQNNFLYGSRRRRPAVP